jgi:hypothetical protein
MRGIGAFNEQDQSLVSYSVMSYPKEEPAGEMINSLLEGQAPKG